MELKNRKKQKPSSKSESVASSASVAQSILMAMEEVRLFEQGKIKLKSANDLLSEL